MIDLFKDDFRRVGLVSECGRPVGLIRRASIFLNSYGLQVLITYRINRWLSGHCGGVKGEILKSPVHVLHKMLERLYDIRISLSADIGPGLYIGHFGGIRIGHCTIGRWCNINQQVVVGREDEADQMSAQVTIGDHVWIGAHSRVAPGVTIAGGSTISVGTQVWKDVPAAALVAGPSCRVLQRHYDNSVLLGLAEI